MTIIKIHTAQTGGVKNRHPKFVETTLEDLARTPPVVLPHTVAGWAALSKRDRNEAKQPLPYLVGGELSGPRSDENITSRALLTLDIEASATRNTSPPPPPSVVIDKLRALGGSGWVYSTISHTEQHPRYRVLLPLTQPLDERATPGALRATSLAAAEKLGIAEWVAPESLVLSQPMFLPARLEDGSFVSSYTPGRAWRPRYSIALGVGSPPKALSTVKTPPADIPEGPVDLTLAAIKSAGLYIKAHTSRAGMHYIKCPYLDAHENENDTQTVYYSPHFDGNPRAACRCFDTAPDTDGGQHLTPRTLTGWLTRNGFMRDDDAITATGELGDFDDFDDACSLAGLLSETPAPRKWAINGFCPVGKVTVLAGPGGVSKSMLMLTALTYLSAGVAWGGFSCDEPLKSLVVSYEDDRTELNFRLASILSAPELADHRETITRNLRVFSAEDSPFSWLLATKPERFSPAQKTERVQWVIDYIKSRGIKVFKLDPAVYAHQLEENAVGEMAAFMQILSRIAREGECAVVLSHHMSKVGAGGALDDLNQGALRGASSISDNARSVGVLVSLPIRDCARYGVDPSPENLSRFAVFKHVKHNYSAPLPTRLFERKGLTLVPRDDLQRLTEVEVARADDVRKELLATDKIAALAERVLLTLSRSNTPLGQNHLAVEAKIKVANIRAAVDFCEGRGWVSVEVGANRARYSAISPAGIKHAKTL